MVIGMNVGSHWDHEIDHTNAKLLVEEDSSKEFLSGQQESQEIDDIHRFVEAPEFIESELSKKETKLVAVTTIALQRMASRASARCVSKFDRSVPEVSLNDYVYRIVKWCNMYIEDHHKTIGDEISEGFRALVMALIFIDRLHEKDPEFAISMRNLHRLVAICMYVATKYMEDFNFNLVYWSEISGLTIKEIRPLEIELCMKLGFDLYVSQEKFASVVSMLCRLAKVEEM